MSGYLARPDRLRKVIDGATATTTVTLPRNPWGRDLLILHQMSGETPSGLCAVTLTPEAGVQIPHHGDTVGLPGTAVTSSYSALVRDVSDVVTLTLTATSGTHTVWVQYLA